MSWFRWMKYVRGEVGPRTRRERWFLVIVRQVVLSAAGAAGYVAHGQLPPNTPFWPVVVVLAIIAGSLLLSLEVLF